MAWTDEMVEELKRLWAEGVTTGEIGRRLNISKNSIVGKVHRLGLSGRPSPIKKKADSPAKEPTTAKEKPAKKPVAKEEKKPVEPKAPSTPSKPATPMPKADPKPQPQADKPASVSTPNEEDIKLAKSLNVLADNQPKKEFLSLTDLDNHTCRWPIGDPKDENFHFCGKKVRIGQTYCEEHSAVAYVKPGKK